MLAEIAAPFVDARASDLALALDGPPEPAFCHLHAELAGFQVELRVLGCSHQVRVRRGEQELSEVVACRRGAAPGLPPVLERLGVGLAYAFRSRTLTYEPDDFAAEAVDILKRVGERPGELVGVFPGLAHAFTALRARPTDTGVCWRSWHAYPQTHEIVRTSSTVCTPAR
jgi:hypothetical protein